MPNLDNTQVVIYHANCSDGFGAAWAAYMKFGESIDYVPADHATKDNDISYWLSVVEGKHVICCDFSFSRVVTEKIHEHAASFHVIDHHASSVEELNGLSYCDIDLDSSGAVLTWKAIFEEDKRVPELLLYVQDRDLWQWKLPDSEKIWSYISTVSQTFHDWDEMSNLLQTTEGKDNIICAGAAMLSKVKKIGADATTHAEVWSIAGFDVLVSNCPGNLRSDVCEHLGLIGKYPFVGCYEISKGSATWSLRSNHGTEDVSIIAGTFPGGGGHKEASGFTVPIERMDFVNRKIV